MKKLVLLLVVMAIAVPCFGLGLNKTTLYMEMTKQTNGSQSIKAPALEMEMRYGDILIEPEIAAIFTSVRGRPWQWNHHSINFNLNMGFERNGWFATFSLGSDTVIAGNSDGIAPGTYLYNTLRVGYETWSQ